MASYYPPVGFHFRVEFGIGEPDADLRFQEVGGLTADIGTEEVKEGGLNLYAHRLPGRVKYNNLTLKRGLLDDSKVAEWVRNALQNFEFEPTEVIVTLLNEEHEPLASWTFAAAYPVKWSISDLKADQSAIVVESMELAFQSFRKN